MNQSRSAEASTETTIVSRHRHMTGVFEAMAQSLGPFIDDRMRAYFSDEASWLDAAANRMGRPTEHGTTDPLFQLLVLRRFWGPVFADYFGKDLRPLVAKLVEARNLWAHFNLPHGVDELDQLVLAAERIVAPVAPEGAVELRELRTQIRKRPNDFDDEQTATSTIDNNPLNDATNGVLSEQLAETERVFTDLQSKYSAMESELEETQLAASTRQRELQFLERELVEINGRSDALELHLAMEKSSKDRIEWLFVGFIAVLLVVMVLMS